MQNVHKNVSLVIRSQGNVPNVRFFCTESTANITVQLAAMIGFVTKNQEFVTVVLKVTKAKTANKVLLRQYQEQI